MSKINLSIYLLIVLLFSCDYNQDLFKIPSVSMSPQEAADNGTLISCYNLKTAKGIDTVLSKCYSWLEFKWSVEVETGVIMIDSNELQLVFPASNRLRKCFNYTKCNFEIYDNKWKSPGLKGDNFYYTCKQSDDLSQVDLWIEVNGKKESDLLFIETTCCW